ncbi:LysE family transporter [Roseobacter sp.]|uniref:LysE family translocator n=1 Tax=Roseobacter sp. TaxID=1907202 RepID=UPI003296E6CB
MLTFAAAVFFLMITPGPGVLSAAGVGAAFGPRVATRYVIGLFIGTNLVCLTIISGVTAAIFADDRLRTVLFGASILYLTYLAVRIALAGSKIAFINRASPPGITGGIMLQAINPKAYAVNTALFTGFGFWPQSYTAEMILKILIVNAIWVPIHFSWLWLGITLQRMNLPSRTQRMINLAMACSMMVVVLLAAVSQL